MTEPTVDLASEWRLIKRLTNAEKLLWLETTPGVEIHFGASLPVMLEKICRLIEKGRVRWELPARDRERLTTPCMCDACRFQRRYPNYYTSEVWKREKRFSRAAPVRGWMAYECWLEWWASRELEEGIPRIPGSVGIVVMHRSGGHRPEDVDANGSWGNTVKTNES